VPRQGLELWGFSVLVVVSMLDGSVLHFLTHITAAPDAGMQQRASTLVVMTGRAA
jgi:hypothetical protein